MRVSNSLDVRERHQFEEPGVSNRRTSFREEQKKARCLHTEVKASRPINKYPRELLRDILVKQRPKMIN